MISKGAIKYLYLTVSKQLAYLKTERGTGASDVRNDKSENKTGALSAPVLFRD
jgi:hypothetical protein